MLFPSSIIAQTFKGTINIEVGETYYVDVDFGSYVTQTGSWEKSNSTFIFINKGNKGCTIKGNKVGTGTLEYWGVVEADIIEYYWTVNVSEKSVKISDIILNKTSLSLNIGDQEQLTATILPSNATNQSLTWSSSNTNVATVGFNGNVTAKAEGSSTITCRANDGSGKYATCYVTVIDNSILVSDITLNTTSTSLKVGGSYQLSATISPKNATDKSVTWSSNNTSVATVSSSGYVTAKAEGSATITCRANDGSGVYAQCIVNVMPEGIEINSTNFPDENFRNYLLNKNYGSDGIITQKEINSITSIDVNNKNIKKLKGIEFFTALKSLYCSGNQLTTLDVSKNTALTGLRCHDNQLTTLNVSKNTSLNVLYCYENKLTTLDVSKNTALIGLRCHDNQLTTLDVSKNTSLNVLYCGGQNLRTLDLSNNTALGWLYCNDNKLTALDVSKNTVLKIIWCYNNQLTTLNVSKNTALTELYCYNNQLTTLDVSKSIALEELACFDNQLTELDVSKNTVLKKNWCYNNLLTTLDVSNTSLAFLWCYKNQIKGSAMDNLINGLRRNSSNIVYSFKVINDINGDEGNVCTTEQVAAVKARGWTPEYWNGTEWLEYAGSEPEIDLTPTAISLPEMMTVGVGKTITLKATLQPANAETTITWASDDTSVVKVTQTGKAMGIKEGVAIVSATTDNGLVAECFVMVANVATGIEEMNTDSQKNAVVYSLSGLRLTSPRKGVNIVNGRKVLVK